MVCTTMSCYNVLVSPLSKKVLMMKVLRNTSPYLKSVTLMSSVLYCATVVSSICNDIIAVHFLLRFIHTKKEDKELSQL